MSDSLKLSFEDTIDDPNTDTLMNHQIELETLFNKNQLLSRVRTEFEQAQNIDFGAHMTECSIPVRFGFDLLAQMAIHKRATLPTLVGLLYHHLDNAQTTTDLLKQSAEADLVDWSPSLKLFVVKFTISDELQAELDLYQYPLPMVVEPRPLNTNRDTGYILGVGSVILRNNHHEDDVCLDHLNRMNSVPLTINRDVARMVQNKWKNLDKAKPGETREEFTQRKKAFIKYDRTARDVMDLLMRENDHFHLTHKYDKRGRVYAQGYHINYQGNPWNKAVIEFATKELIE